MNDMNIDINTPSDADEIHIRRLARIKKMKKKKARQLFFRTHMRLIICLGAAAVILLITALALLIHAKRTPADTEQNAAFAENEPTIEEPEALETESETAEDTEEENSYIDSEYGPYANVYSEEKDIFFEGYKVNSASSPAGISDEVLSTNAVLIDAETGDVIAARDSSVRIYPASMTKILTVLVAAEHVTDLDDKFLIDISITDYAYSHDCSAVGFSCDETVTVRDLMYGTVLPSGADAALALAEYVAGSHEGFVEMMNDKLEELGLSETSHFTNCVGVYDDNHYSTLNDIAMIMKAAVENDLAKEILQAHIYTTTHTTEHPDGIEISNWFLRRIEDKDTNGEVVCAKTGFVNESGCCGASYEVTNSGKHYICVTANAWSSWRCIYDHVAIYSAFVS